MLAIRIPGGTVGAIYLDEENVIINITIERDYVVKTYPEDVNEKMASFIGEKIELEEIR